MKKALITGITGQDGSYLTELLLEKGYEVHGIIRRQSSQNTERIDHVLNDSAFDKRVFLHYGDLTDSSNAHALIREIQPDEVYNLAAQSHVAVSFEVPEYTAEATGVGTIRLLEAVRQSGLPIRFYQASTSELFGGLPGKVVGFKIKIKGKEAKIMPSKIVFWARIAEANDKFHRVDYNA